MKLLSFHFVDAYLFFTFIVAQKVLRIRVVHFVEHLKRNYEKLNFLRG